MKVPGQRIVLIGIFVGALTIRLGWALHVDGRALTYSDDAKAFQDLAVNLATSHQFNTTIDPPHRSDLPYAQRAPLTPLVLAIAYTGFGSRFIVGQLVFACTSAVSVLVAFRLGKKLFGENVGIATGLIAATYPFFVFLSAIPLSENLAILLYTLLTLLLIDIGKKRSNRHAIATGCILGLAALNRPQILGFLPFLGVLALADSDSALAHRMRWLAIAVVTAGVVLLPWTVRNRVVIGGWFPVSLQGGFVLYQGNNPYTQTALDHLQSGARGWYDDPRFAEPLAGLSPLERDRTALHLGFQFMRAHPGLTARYSFQKIALFLSAYDHPVARASWYPILAFGVIGFGLSIRRWRDLLPLYLIVLQTALTAAIFTSMPRFRAPVEPILILMAAFAALQVWERVRGRSQSREGEISSTR